MHSLITQKKIAKEGDPPGHEATALPFALQHLCGEVDSSRALIKRSACVTKWPT